MFLEYIIKDDDTMESLAKKFDISPKIIKMINDADIKAGNKILIPKKNSQYLDYYRVKKGDTLYKIASINGINPSLLALLNGINEDDYIYDNQLILIPKAGSILYISSVGDTISSIADELNISQDELIKQNNNIYLQPEQLIVYKYE